MFALYAMRSCAVEILVVQANAHNSWVSKGALCARCSRITKSPVFSVHSTDRYWSELTIEQRRAGIALGYTAELWDDRVDEFGQPVFRSVWSQDQSGQRKQKQNPITNLIRSVSDVARIEVASNFLARPLVGGWKAFRRLLKGDRAKYAFLVAAYRPGAFYWELVEYLRKFVLTGVLTFIEPGTVTQVFVGSLVTLVYVLLVSRVLPYRDPQTNQTKMLSETTLLFIFLATLAMRNDLAGEYLDRSKVSDMMVAVVMVGNVLPCLNNMVSAFRRYFTSLDNLQKSLDKGSALASSKKSNRCKRMKSHFHKLYS